MLAEPHSRAAVRNGTVKVSVRRGRRAIASRTVPVRTRCGFAFRATVKRARVGRARRLAVRLRFNGNDALAAVTKVGSIRVER